jgi:hypothetical protein
MKDDKYGRTEGQGLLKVMEGLIKKGMNDKMLLQRGMEMVEVLYLSIE